jgi:hypothetical protein
VFLGGAELLAHLNGIRIDRLWRGRIQREGWEGELMSPLTACITRLCITAESEPSRIDGPKCAEI